MKFNKNPQTISYILRNLITANIEDPLSQESRGSTEYTQYFYADNSSTQLLYLERKPTTNGMFEVTVDGTLIFLTTDYTLDKTNMILTIIKQYTLNAEIKVSYDASKQWVYDDHPNLNAGDFPRITLDALPTTFETNQMGEYLNYTSGIGNLVTAKFKIIIRNRQNNNYYTYDGDKLKNYDLINAISNKIVRYFKLHKQNSLWKFRTFNIDNVTRINTEEDSGILRNDIDLEVIYFHNE